MPAVTHSRRSAYSAWEIEGSPSGGFAATSPRSEEAPLPLRGTSPLRGEDVSFLVRGKLAHRLGDLLRAGHEEILLRSVEGHGGDVGRSDPRHRPIEVV